MKVPIINKVKKLFIANKTVLIAVTMSLAIAVPATIILSSNKNNDNNSAITTEQKTDQVNETDKDTSTQPVDTPKVEQSKPATTSKPKQNTSQPKTTTPTPTAPTPTAPTPTVLANCFYAEGEKAGQNCPYNPPPSWSSLPLYNCYTGNNHMSGAYTACSDYRSTVSIRPIAYYENGNVPTQFCVFVFSNGTYKRTRVNISSDTANIRCHSDQAFTYDPWAN